MEKLSLQDLELSIPSINELTTRKLMGGGYSDGNPNDSKEDNDGYIDGGMLDIDVVVVADDLSKPDDFDPRKDQFDPNEDDHAKGDENNTSNDQNIGEEGNNDPTKNPEMDQLLESVNEHLKDLIERLGLTIHFDPNLEVPGEYNQTDKSITLNEYNADTFEHELIHALQDELGNLGSDSRSNVEFQDHFLIDLLNFYESDGALGNSTVEDSDWGDYYNWLSEITNDGDEDTPFDRNAFIEGFEDFYDSFLERNEGTPYGDHNNDDFDWKWEQMFEYLGIK